MDCVFSRCQHLCFTAKELESMSFESVELLRELASECYAWDLSRSGLTPESPSFCGMLLPLFFSAIPIFPPWCFHRWYHPPLSSYSVTCHSPCSIPFPYAMEQPAQPAIGDASAGQLGLCKGRDPQTPPQPWGLDPSVFCPPPQSPQNTFSSLFFFFRIKNLKKEYKKGKNERVEALKGTMTSYLHGCLI